MTKANPAFSPSSVRCRNVFRNEHHRSWLADELVFVRVGLRRDQGQHSRAIGRRNRYQALTGLQTHVIGHAEAKLVQVKPQAPLLITHVDVDGLHAEVGVVLLRVKFRLIQQTDGWRVGHGRSL